MNRRHTVAIVVLVAVGLLLSGLLILGWSPDARIWPAASRCTAPATADTKVTVTLTNMGHGMMGGGGPMRLIVDQGTVPAGQVMVQAVNTGSIRHELVVLPLPEGQEVGTRSTGSDGKVDETQSLGEASKTCGAGAGDGIDPAGVGWVTLHLTPGRYELICNLPGHYQAGMYAELTVGPRTGT